MQCPYCHSDRLRVVDSIETEETIRRRRECEQCKKRFTTHEKIEGKPIIIIKKDGRREPFDRNKVLKGIMVACGKRPVSQEKIENIVDQVEAELKNMDTTEIKSKVIGDFIMEKLKDVDNIAYIRFASVYKKFKDIESFEKELKELKKGG